MKPLSEMESPTGGGEDEQRRAFGSEDRPAHHCGLFGVYGVPGAARVVLRGLMALQHRGEEGAGIAVSDGRIVRSVRAMGLAAEMAERHATQLAELRGEIGIGHVRYSTTGASDLRNVQPIAVECRDGVWAIAHNGNLTNAAELRSQRQAQGAIFQTGTDSEILLHMIAHPRYARRSSPVAAALRDLRGAFSFLLLHGDELIAARDRHGFRPLCLGRLGGGHVIASETCALRQVGAEFIREIEPGELLRIRGGRLLRERFVAGNGRPGQCVFEHIYFARPDSRLFGESVHEVRVRFGQRLAREQPAPADVVIPIPDSGVSAAIGYARQTGLPLDFGFIRNHYIGRTFIQPSAGERTDAVDLKLAIVEDVVRGRRVVVVDDSLVRGTTVRRRVRALREAGALEVHVRIASPPVRWPCHFGIDFPTRAELAAATREPQEIARMIGADSLGYLSLGGLRAELATPSRYCVGCFTGRYPERVPSPTPKHAFEVCAAAAPEVTR
ncbi:MAG: amidophosphoribosyltransferase [Kiritimatiellae bacterium]|nr:amidophosphoribosyltransferase [Kiritimatiellia bacterium]